MMQRMLRMPIVRLAVLAVGLLGLLILLQALLHRVSLAVPSGWRLPARIVGEVAVGIVMILAYRGAVSLTEHRVASELAFDRRIAWFVPGALVGAFLFCTVCVLLWAAGVATYGGWNGAAGIAFAVASALVAAVAEEVIFRGIVFRIIEDRSGTLVGLVVSAALFGLLHGANTGATVASTVSIALEAGVLLGLAYCAVRSLWLPIGLHFGWNFTEGGIFGASVSGGHSHGMLFFPLKGPVMLTGGAFGPEASLVAVAVCLGACGVLTRVTVRGGNWRGHTRG
jgi:uncharacterized protein